MSLGKMHSKQTNDKQAHLIACSSLILVNIYTRSRTLSPLDDSYADLKRKLIAPKISVSRITRKISTVHKLDFDHLKFLSSKMKKKYINRKVTNQGLYGMLLGSNL